MIIIRPRNPKLWFLLGLFVLCMFTLMMQIIETRILSVISYYHLAFLSISMAMFGMTAGSLFVYFQERWFPAERLFENLVWICGAFAIAVELSTLFLLSTVLMIGGKPEFLMMVLLWLKLIIILAAPYFFAGMAISLALTLGPSLSFTASIFSGRRPAAWLFLQCLLLSIPFQHCFLLAP